MDGANMNAQVCFVFLVIDCLFQFVEDLHSKYEVIYV